ncbi:FAD-dependent monooxygenase [Amycolatopsis sp. NPDC049159]|uniref:FAD-dependent monooxygenase n=1 Tax=Amycolatopsis sp. NPDC049159 TaxID=3157210 RepID=UPI0033C597B3
MTDLLAQYAGAGGEHRIECDFVAGCDGARGVTQGYLPAESTVKAHHDYGIGWPALLADGALSGIHPRGFGAHTARTPGVTRFSLQTAAGEPEADWPDERVRRELQARLVAPIAAKGMNLALHDAFLLAEAFQAYYAGDSAPLAGYSAACLPLVWQYQEFSLCLSDIFHHTAAAAENPFPARIAEARMRRLLGSPAAAAAFAELYTGKNADL